MNRRTFFGGCGVGAVGLVFPRISESKPILASDEPTYITQTGTKVWLNEYGEYHRIGGSAIISADGTKEWFQNGLYHRIGGPAVVYPDGRRSWYEHNNRHRIGGPAMIWTDFEHWYENNVLHRVGGPAIIRANGTEEWYEYGQRIKK